MRATDEMLLNIKQIKLNNLEAFFLSRVIRVLKIENFISS